MHFSGHVNDYILGRGKDSCQAAIASFRETTINKPATIQDVARAAEVSTATVSRALSAPERVSTQTRAAVVEAVRATGYRVNQAARNLRTQRANAVLVMVHNLGKPFYSEILAGLSEGFAGSDYAVLITDTESAPLAEGALAGYFRDGRIDGAISLDGSLSRRALGECTAQGVGERIVFLCEWVDGAGFPAIKVDNAEGARIAVQHLHALGHRRIAHVAGPEGNVLTESRRSGMVEACEALGLDVPAHWLFPGDFSLESGQVAAARILGMAERPTAVFCSADMAAFGVISGLRAGGLRVPDDISVVGFDDIEMAAVYDPALTTIRQERRQLGRRAAQVLTARVLGRDEPGEMLPVTLVERASTGPAPT